MLARSLRVPALTALLAAGCIAAAARADAGTFVVDTTADAPALTTCDDAAPDDCSLRGAIFAANARPVAEQSTIDVPAGTYFLTGSSSCTYRRRGNPNANTTTEGPLCVARNVTLQGAGAASTIIDANRAYRVLFVSDGAAVEVRGVTMTRGLADRGFNGSPSGGAIDNEGTLTLVDSVVSESTLDPLAAGTSGAGIYNAGVLTLLGSTVSNNASANSCGGGIVNEQRAILTVSDSTIADNEIGVHGGGICNFQGVVTITNSTVSGNTAGGLGGGIVNFGGNFIGSLTVINSTISGNTSGGSGGGIHNAFLTDVFLINVTITDNDAGAISGDGGGIRNNSPRVFSLRNTLIAGNRSLSPANADCMTDTPLLSGGHNLIQVIGSCTMTGDTTGNLTGLDPALGVLTNNGGVTKTHAPSDGSPAIDAGSPAAPGSGGTACAAIDQRGLLRPLGATCDIGAVEHSAAFALTKLRPRSGGNSGSVSSFVGGSGFADGATVKLTRTGEPDVVAEPTQVDAGGSAIAATFDLVGRPVGAWDVVVTNPDGASRTLPAGFSIEAGGAPDVWVSVIGGLVRRGPSRLTILYGNRGNVDAVAAPLSLSLGTNFTPSRAFAIAPPPFQSGQVREDWSQVSVVVSTGAPRGFFDIPLLLPVVPAGFAGTLPISVVFPLDVPDSFLLTALGDPLFAPTLDPSVVDDAVTGAIAALQGAGVNVPPLLVQELERYAENQFQQLVDDGRAVFATSVGTWVQVYSLSQLQFDLVLFGAASAADGAVARIPTIYAALASLASTLGANEASARQDCPVYKKGDILTPGCSGGGGDEPFLPPGVPLPPGCDLKNPSTYKNCTPGPEQCEALPGYKVVTADNGDQFCVPTNPDKRCTKAIANPVGGNQGCIKYPLKPRNSADPNEKIGTLGVTPAQFVREAEPLAYVVHFENLEAATAPAQEVVVTDQLDVSQLDLETFSLGPISFGDETLTPAPGVQEYTGGIDLRPGQNLIVTVQAGLDGATGLITWRFTSIDPGTGQLTEDPDAGFLPPNVNPPAGQGRVVFSVQPRPGLASGAEIRNRASIVFDTNAPIETADWLNTLDASAPVSQVDNVDPADCNATALTVHWSGVDGGSGVASYSVFVSTDGAPFEPLVTDTTATAAPFTGEAGRTYGFYAVAEDEAGNAEAPPAAPDVVRVVGGCGTNDLALTKISAPTRVVLNGKNPTRIARVRVEIQNRSPHPETVPDQATLARLVDLDVQAVAPGCSAPAATLHVGQPQKRLPVTIKSKKRLVVVFDVPIGCAVDPLQTSVRKPGHDDYSLSASVHRSALGSGDAHAADDVCPRSVTPPGVLDPFPDGKLIDKGCGAKKADKTFGAPIRIDVVVKP